MRADGSAAVGWKVAYDLQWEAVQALDRRHGRLFDDLEQWPPRGALDAHSGTQVS